jgi:hypothetical protein
MPPNRWVTRTQCRRKARSVAQAARVQRHARWNILRAGAQAAIYKSTVSPVCQQVKDQYET